MLGIGERGKRGVWKREELGERRGETRRGEGSGEVGERLCRRSGWKSGEGEWGIIGIWPI